MPTDLYSAYNSLSVAKKQEAYDFIMFLSSREKAISPAKKKLSAFGILNEYANPSLIEQEDGAWARAAAENYKDEL